MFGLWGGDCFDRQIQVIGIILVIKNKPVCVGFISGFGSVGLRFGFMVQLPVVL